MRKESLAFLEKLVAAPSPSGYEQPAQRVYREYAGKFCEITTDVMGNAIGFLPGKGTDRPKVMLVGHSDEIGLQVRYIDDNGFLFFCPGGYCPSGSASLQVETTLY